MLFLLSLLAASAFAGPTDDAWQAYLKADYKKALELARPAAEKGDIGSQNILGTLYCYGKGVPINYAEAEKWYRKSADAGNADGEQALGFLYQKGWGVKQDYLEAARWYRKSAQQGNAYGECGLGWAYQYGWGVKQDYAEALKWFRKSAEKGNQGGQHGLGWFYQNGFGVKQDYGEAAKWYRRAAEQGNQHAQAGLGWLYQSGLGVKQDYAEAAKWYLKSADQGNSFGQSGLGACYQYGWGVKQDYAEAARWFRLSSEQKNPFAQAALAFLYHRGLGVAADFGESEKLARDSAAQGNPYGQIALGYLYENGLGVVQDYVEAYKWNLLAGAQNNAEARQAMERLRVLMTKEQVAEAQKLAASVKTSPQTAATAPPAFPDKNLSSDVDHPGFRLKENPLNFAVVIGVEKYKDLPQADFAERDAEAVRENLVSLGYPERNVILLKGPNATISGLKKYVDEWLPRNVPQDGNVFFYFSGHGAPDPKTGEAYLIPWDGDAGFLKSTAYPVKKLYASMAALPAAKVWVALDSCFSGGGGRSVLAKGARPLVTKVEGALAPKGKITLFAAASGEEITGTLDSEGHGIFTYYFLKGVAGEKDLNARKVYDFLKPKVQDAARRQNRDQTPVLAEGGAANSASLVP